MNTGSTNVSEQNQVKVGAIVSNQHPKLRARGLLLVSIVLFIAYVINILLGVLVLQHGVSVSFLSDVPEFLLLFSSVAGFVLFMLLNEKSKS